MQIAAVFTAVSADYEGDTLQVRGGLWDGLQTQTWPAEQRITVVTLLRMRPQDVGVSHHVDVNVYGPDGGGAGHQHGDVVVNVHREQVPVVLTVPAVMSVAGVHRVVVSFPFGKSEVTFTLVGPDASPIQSAVGGYAFGLGQQR